MNDTQNKPQDTKIPVAKATDAAVKQVTPAVASKDTTPVKTEVK